MQEAEDKTKPPKTIQEFLARCPGDVGLIARYIQSRLPAELPSISLACAFSYVGFLLSRRAFHKSDFFTTEPCLFTCIISDTGMGKSAAVSILKELSELSGIELRDDQGHFMGKPGSEAGVIKALHDQSQQFLPLTEFGLFISAILKSKNSYEAKILALLLDIYSENGKYFRDGQILSRKRQDITAPYLSVLGVSTSKRLFENLTQMSLADGTLSRFVMYIEPNKIIRRKPQPGDLALKEEAIAAVKRLWNWVRKDKAGNLYQTIGAGEILKLNVEIEDVPAFNNVFTPLEIYQDEIDDLRNGYESSTKAILSSRAMENTIKMCICLGERNNTEVTCSRDNLKYAIWLNKFLINQAAKYIDLNLFDTYKEKERARTVDLLIRHLPINTWVTKEALGSKTPRMSAKEREELLKDLIESRVLAHEERKNPSGRLASHYMRTRNI
jgi:hypothetical protein